MLGYKIGIDLGTCNSLVYVPKRGIILEEPSVVALDVKENKVLAVGKEAKEMVGKTPEDIQVYRPLKEGVIADYKVTKAMLSYFIHKALGSFRFLKPEIVISVPVGITSTEKRAVIEAALSAGAKACYPVKEPVLAAIGAELPIYSNVGHMIINIGGGTSEIAVLSLGGIVCAKSVRVGGDKIDQAIANFIKQKHNLWIGEQTAERIKIEIGSAILQKEEKEMVVKGRDAVSGLPREIKISTNQLIEPIQDVLKEILQAIKQVLRETPPELSADIMERGMYLSGGTSLLTGIDEYFSKGTGVITSKTKDPLRAVAKGTGLVLENLEAYKKVLITQRWN